MEVKQRAEGGRQKDPFPDTFLAKHYKNQEATRWRKWPSALSSSPLEPLLPVAGFPFSRCAAPAPHRAGNSGAAGRWSCTVFAALANVGYCHHYPATD